MPVRCLGKASTSHTQRNRVTINLSTSSRFRFFVPRRTQLLHTTITRLLMPLRSQEFVSKYSGAAEAAVAAGGTVAPAKRKAPEAKKGSASSSSSGGKKAKGRSGGK